MDIRCQWEERERRELAPYACRSVESRGRRHPEKEHAARTCFQRDRDRILHSRCFRRLEYKTQVFINGTADHYRTRMTHTMEMAAVARTLARIFRVNEDLTESICLAHDIGHTPFGHAGEEELDRLMKGHGGFDHNEQSLRWVDFLELAYPGFDGLNLTWELRAGLMKHRAADPAARLDGFPVGPFQSLEAQIADLADDITYIAHDADDALEAGLLTEESLAEEPLWQAACEHAEAQYPGLNGECRIRIAVRNLLDLQVRDIITSSLRRIEERAPGSPQEVLQGPVRLVDYSGEMGPAARSFRDFMYEQVYWNVSVRSQNNEALKMMRRLFYHYLEHPESMGSKARARIDRCGLRRTVCDYVSGFTDRYAIEEFHARGLF
jgi:dGTPase